MPWQRLSASHVEQIEQARTIVVSKKSAWRREGCGNDVDNISVTGFPSKWRLGLNQCNITPSSKGGSIENGGLVGLAVTIRGLLRDAFVKGVKSLLVSR